MNFNRLSLITLLLFLIFGILLASAGPYSSDLELVEECVEETLVEDLAEEFAPSTSSGGCWIANLFNAVCLVDRADCSIPRVFSESFPTTGSLNWMMPLRI